MHKQCSSRYSYKRVYFGERTTNLQINVIFFDKLSIVSSLVVDCEMTAAVALSRRSDVV